MRVPRAFVPVALSPGETVELTPSDAVHLVRVLRRRIGDPIVVATPDGQQFEARLAEVHEAPGALRARARILAPLPQASGSASDGPSTFLTAPWTVGVAIVKGDAFDLAIRMANELGIGTLVPLLTERTVARPASGSAKLERWRRIAAESTKQCGRASPMEVRAVVRLDEFLREEHRGDRCVLVPGAPGRVPSAISGASSGPTPVGADPARSPADLPEATFILGPEGGLTEGEIRAAAEHGFATWSLPLPVLRTPTAVALVGALACVLGGARGGRETPGGASGATPARPLPSVEPVEEQP